MFSLVGRPNNALQRTRPSRHCCNPRLIGGIIGCFAGYQARARLVESLRQPDFNVAMLEDLVAIGGSLFIVSRL